MPQLQDHQTRPTTVHAGNAAAVVEQVRSLLTGRPFILTVDERPCGPGELDACRVLDGTAVGLLITLGEGGWQALFAGIASSADAALEPNATHLQVDFHDGITLRRVGRTAQGAHAQTT